MGNHLTSGLKILGLTGLMLLSSCDEPKPVSSFSINQSQLDHSVGELRSLAQTNARKSIIFAEGLNVEVQKFLSAPNETNLAAMGAAWTKAHNAYVSLTRLQANEQSSQFEHEIDQWPIAAGYLDSVPEYPDSGIVNDITVIISAQNLREQHGFTDPLEGSIGFHPLEHLIYGKAPADYLLTGEDDEIIIRRRNVLAILAAELVTDINKRVSEIDVRVVSYQQPDSKPTAPDLLLELISRARYAAGQAFGDGNLILDTQFGHGHKSNTAMQILSLELETLQQLMFEPVELARVIETLAPQTIKDLRTTLEEARNSTIQPAAEVDPARLLLMLSAINHQFDDIHVALTQALEPPKSEGFR